jgi:DNA-binding response OmpR family regulator
LRREGHEVDSAGDGLAALTGAASRPPDLVILDIMLPGIDGLEVCRRLRRTSSVPILMLTARGEEMDRVIGLEVGADDYLSKPFGMRELMARVRALLRRRELLREELGQDAPAGAEPGLLEAGDLTVDVRGHRVLRGTQEILLTAKEFGLLETLLRHRGRVLTLGQLLEHVWGYQEGDPRTVTVHIHNLRAKLAAGATSGPEIETVRGVGYRFRK